MCTALKEADSAPVPDKCPTIDKADWLICLLQTKYENVTRCHDGPATAKDGRNANGIAKVPMGWEGGATVGFWGLKGFNSYELSI